MNPTRFLKTTFVGKGSYTDMGDRYPVLDKNRQSNIKDLYVVGDIAGTPDIKAAINSGHQMATHLASLPRPAIGPADCEVLIIGGGPAGVSAAIELEKRGVSYLLLERKRLFNSVATLGKSRKLYLAETGPSVVHNDLGFQDCTVGECLSNWAQHLQHRELRVRLGEVVSKISKRDLFEVKTDNRTYLAHRVVVAIGKLTFLGRLDPVGEKNPNVRYVLDDAEQRFSGKRLLVIASDACSLAFETACKLAADNDVTLICEESHEHSGETKIDCGCVDVKMAGNITFVPSTKVTAVRGGDVEIESPDGQQRRSFDYVLPMTRFEREVPIDTLKAFGLKYENRWDLRRLWTFIPVLAVVAAFYTALKFWGWQYRWLGLYAGDFYPIIYSLLVVGFGLKAMYKYAFVYNDKAQIKRYLSMMFFQVVFFTVLPLFVIRSGGSWGLAYVWPLSLRPGNWEDWAHTKEFYLAWVLFITLVALPLGVWLKGKSYCSWICGCGALAETVGDGWRHYSPKGPANTAREKQVHYVTAFALVATALVALGVDHLAAGVSITGVYTFTVDLALIAIIPIACYPFFGGKMWCRYWCPAVGLMNLFHQAKPKSIRTFGIASRKERCIACGMCDRFCEVGVPVKSFALKGRFFDMSNSSCISCGICISVCPTRVLSFSTTVPLTVAR
ncbi:MAG: NAD(P)-binding domain-containing protein [Phycisphaerae bacterium]